MGFMGVGCVSGVGVFEVVVGWFVRAVTCICVISVSLFRLVVGFVTVVGCWARLLSSLRASSSSIYRISMASALSNGSCGGTDFAGVIIFSTDCYRVPAGGEHSPPRSRARVA